MIWIHTDCRPAYTLLLEAMPIADCERKRCMFWFCHLRRKMATIIQSPDKFVPNIRRTMPRHARRRRCPRTISDLIFPIEGEQQAPSPAVTTVPIEAPVGGEVGVGL